MIDVYDYFKKMQDEKVILYYKGEISNNILTSILQLVDDKLERKSEDIKIKKKVFSILLECLQNIYNYQQRYQDYSELLQSAMLMIQRTDEAYFISTGNFVEKDRVKQLEERIKKVNSLSSDGLKDFYKEVLSKQEYSDTGGAGLGLIDMARKSGEKINYSFDIYSDKHCFYSLQIKVLVDQ